MNANSIGNAMWVMLRQLIAIFLLFILRLLYNLNILWANYKYMRIVIINLFLDIFMR